jgi:hypothetical protein
MVAAFNNFIDLGFILMSDILELTETDYESRSPSWRRNYIRASIALIEGYGHCLREMCAVGVSACSTPSISPKERQVLHDESGFDTSERIKLTLRTAYKLFELRPTPDFAGRDWTQAKWALRKRHLLMHPKTPADMDIPDDLWKQLAPAMDWLIDQHFTFLKLLIAKVPALQRR